jgi:DNA-binding beta-propeller fold protein YncE
MLTIGRRIAIPGGAGSGFDHGAFDEVTGLVFLAHTGADRVEVLEPSRASYVRSLSGHPEAAGVAAANGVVAVTNRGDGSMSILEAATGDETRRLAVGPRPNGVAVDRTGAIAVAATLGDDQVGPTFVCCDLREDSMTSIPLPGQPRWCVIDSAKQLAYCAIRSPSAVLVVDLEQYRVVAEWPVTANGAHGLDLDSRGQRLFVACDAGELVEVDTRDGRVVGSWPLPGAPDATVYSAESGLVHVAVGDPGMLATVDPRRPGKVELTATGRGAKTIAPAGPGRLYAFLPDTREALELLEST